jgi:hypothetical protein
MPGAVGPVEGREPTLVPQEAVDHAVGVGVLAHHLTAVVDADHPGLHRTRDIDPRELAAVQQKATLWSVGVLRVGAGVAVDARDLSTATGPSSGHGC